jgi:LPXTG-motif cell wall-anchored protein
MTFNEITSVIVDPNGLNINYATTAGAGITTTAKTGNGDYGEWTKPADAAAAVEADGGQAIKVVFKNFKETVEDDWDNNTDGTQNLIGKNIVVTYTAYLNNKASYGASSNENSVAFDYSNNPNHEYDGDEPGTDDDEVTGKTPQSNTKTYVTTLVINKVDGDEKALAGATFEISGTTWNYVLETGEKFVASDYVAANGETVKEGVYYKLKDGSYTITEANENTTANYESTTTTYKLVTYTNVVKKAGDDVKLTVISDENGKIELDGLKAGTYTVKETIAPSGYNLDTTERTLVVNWIDPTADSASDDIKKAGGFSIGTGSDTGFSMDETGAQFEITIQNQSGTTLPSTGGIGTTVFYVVGAILVCGAGITLVTRRRMGADK